MRKITLFTLLLLAFTAKAQITLENQYNGSLSLIQVDANEWNYSNYDGSSIEVYDINHSLITNITVPVPIGFNASNTIQHLSKKLFDNDAGYEYVAIFIDGSNNRVLKVYNDDGTELLSVTDGFFAIAKNTNQGAKILIGLSTGGTDVYSVPGTVLKVKENESVQLGDAYPNPTSTHVVLPYELAQGKQGQLNLYNQQGQIVKSFAVGSAFNNVRVQASDLPAGIYYYNITVEGASSVSKKIVVQ